jgi:hypothetical protein
MVGWEQFGFHFVDFGFEYCKLLKPVCNEDQSLPSILLAVGHTYIGKQSVTKLSYPVSNNFY